MTISIPVGSRSGRPASVFAPAFARLRSWSAERAERRRLERELQLHTDRDLAELGMSRSDIGDVVRGTFRAS